MGERWPDFGAFGPVGGQVLTRLGRRFGREWHEAMGRRSRGISTRLARSGTGAVISTRLARSDGTEPGMERQGTERRHGAPVWRHERRELHLPLAIAPVSWWGWISTVNER